MEPMTATAPDLIDGLWLICEESEWAIPAHEHIARERVARGAVVGYDDSRFEAQVERIDLDDAKLTPVWGHHVWRIRLQATGLPSSGSHTLVVTAT